MQADHLFYKHSGRFRAGFLITAPCLVIPVALLASFIYTYANIYIPIVGIVTVFLLGGYAFLMGLTIAWLCRKLKVRNPALCWVSGALTGLLSLYLSWAVFIFAMIARSESAQDVPFLAVLFSPLGIWEIARAINETGWFSIGSSSSTSVSGIFLWVIWACEALVIVLLPTVMAGKAIADELFCEKCNAWAEHLKGVMALEPALAADFAHQARGGDVSGLAKVPAWNNSGFNWARLDLWRCAGCKEFFGLGVKEVTVKVDSKGNESSSESTLLPPLLINAEQYRQTMATVKAAQEAAAAVAPAAVETPPAAEAQG